MPSVVFGDNHLFGINHLSFQKADEYKKLYSDREELVKLFLTLKECNIGEQMMSSHITASDVVDMALKTHSSLVIHPVIPYAHAINDSAASNGVVKTAINLLRPSLLDAGLSMFRLLLPYTNLTTPYSSLKRFVASQLSVFSDVPPSNKGVLFINNVFCDLLIGLGLYEWFDYLPKVCSEFGYQAGVITYNPRFFLKHNFEEITICMNHNHIGHLINLNPAELSELNDKYSVWAMGVFGSGAYSISSVIPDLNKEKFKKVVFASSKKSRIIEFSGALR